MLREPTARPLFGLMRLWMVLVAFSISLCLLLLSLMQLIVVCSEAVTVVGVGLSTAPTLILNFPCPGKPKYLTRTYLSAWSELR
jgi:hypothetical protein